MVYACKCFNICVHIFKKYSSLQELQDCGNQDDKQMHDIDETFSNFIIVELGLGVTIERPELVQRDLVASHTDWEATTCYNCGTKCFIQSKKKCQYIKLNTEMNEYPNTEVARQSHNNYSQAFHICIDVPIEKKETARHIESMDDLTQLKLSKIQSQLGDYQKKETKAMQDRVAEFERQEREKIRNIFEAAQHECDYLMKKVHELRRKELANMSVQAETEARSTMIDCGNALPILEGGPAAYHGEFRKVIIAPASPVIRGAHDEGEIDDLLLNHRIFSPVDEKQTNETLPGLSDTYAGVASRSQRLSQSLYAKYCDKAEEEPPVANVLNVVSSLPEAKVLQEVQGRLLSSWKNHTIDEAIDEDVLKHNDIVETVFSLEVDSNGHSDSEIHDDDDTEEDVPNREREMESCEFHPLASNFYGSSLPIQVPRLSERKMIRGYATSWCAERVLIA